MFELLAQVLIPACALAAIGLSIFGGERYRKYAPIVGFAAQPAWLYSAAVAHQWGGVISAVAWMCFWGYGFYDCWLKGKPYSNWYNATPEGMPFQDTSRMR